MKVWLVKLEESVPLDVDYRPYRMGMLSDALVRSGHDVLRWCSDRNHRLRENRFGFTNRYRFDSNTEFYFLASSIPYNSPVSALRHLDNMVLAWKFWWIGRHSDPPDVIVCSMPTPEMSKLSARLARRFGAPLVLDARDLWPDIIDRELSGIRKAVAKPFVYQMRRSLRYASKHATSLVGITDFYRDHLLRYGRRKLTREDQVFPLGYDLDQVALSPDDVVEAQAFWNTLGISDSQDQSIIYFAGRLNNTVLNGIAPVVEAAAMLEKQDPATIFVFAGSGQRSDDIRKSFSDLKNVKFPGEVSSKHLLYLRTISLAALLPIERRTDYQNSLSNKFFEYLSSGLPVLSWLDGLPGKTVIAAECGFIYNSGFNLAERIVQLKTHENLRTLMAKNARRLFEDRFEAKKVYGDFAEHVISIATTHKVATT